MPKPSKKAKPKFQFLYGAIKRFAGMYIPRTVYRFQFLYGAIKSPLSHLDVVSISYFNSSMVRLKGDVASNQYVSIWFQFLYGAIKSEDTPNGVITLPKFQFLYGAIKSTSLDTIPYNKNLFQFLYGAIKRENFQWRYAGSYISIPLWCD